MITRTGLFVVAFTTSVVVGRLTILPETGLALFWPPAGVAVLWGLYVASRRELGIAAGIVFLIAAVGNGATGLPFATSLFLGLANAIFVLVVRGLMAWDRTRRWPIDVGSSSLSGLTDVYRFLAAGGVAVLLSTGLGMTGIALSSTEVTWRTALAWAVRNAAAIVVIAGPGLAIRDSRRLVTARAVTSALPLFVVTAVLMWFVFGPGRSLPLSFLPLALLFWAGLRLPLPLAAAEGLFGAFTSLFLVRGFGGGPFGTIQDDLAFSVTMQSYMLLAVGLPLVVATVQRERDRLLGDVARAAQHSSLQADDLRVITETIPDGIVVVGRDGSVLLHNEAAGQWLGGGETFFRASTFVARREDGSVMPMDERPSMRALAGETVRGALVLSEDLRSGESRLVAIDAVPMHDGDDGHVQRVLLIFHDVSDEQARLHALEAERQRTERLISDAPHGVAVLDLSGRVLQVNDSLAALAGRTVDEVVGMEFADLSPTHRAKMGVYLERAVAFPGELLVGDWTIESLDGEDAHVSLTSRVLSSPDEHDDVILVNVVDFSDRRRYEERLTYLADHDALTTMPNRRRFDEALEEHLRLCARRGPTGALLLLDLDKFKEVNDTMGHTAGDELIVSISMVIRDSLRAGDVVARLGGDEFAVLLPDADQTGAEAVAAMLVERVRAHCTSLDGAKRRVTVSVGAVTFAAAAQQAVDPLALADMLLYDAKEAGRNQHAVLEASGTQQPRSGARLEWMARIESAIENDAFELYLQPILDVRSNRIVAAEALLRLVDRGVPVAPGRFVHIAERSGIAPELDRWVVRNAVATLARLHEYAPEMVLEVNLSGHSIGDESVEREFVDALRRHGVAADKFVVEATETAAVADVPAARAFSQRLGAMGTRVAIDDFGAGFGSFYYLKHLPFDIVKIDGEFVAGAHTSAVDRAILRSIVGVARNLGKETVAEFVAEAAVLEVVRELGVDFAQGYYIGEPVPFDVFVERHVGNGSSAWTTTGSTQAGHRSALLIGGELL